MNKYRKRLKALNDEEIARLSKDGRVLDIPASAKRKWIILEWLERCDKVFSFRSFRNYSVMFPASRSKDGKKSYFLSILEE